MLINIFKYLSGDILVKLLGFISLPVYTYFLTPDEYGIYSVFLSYMAIGVIVFTFNTHASVGRFIYDKDINIGSFLYVTLLVAVLGILISSISLCMLDKQYLLETLQFDINKYGIFLILLIFLNTIHNVYNQILVAKKQSKEYTLLLAIKAYTGFFISLGFIYFYEASSISMIWGITVVTLLMTIYIFYKLYKQLVFSFDRYALKYIFTYSVFLIPYALSGVIMSQIDRIMLANMVSTYSAGIYSVATVLGLIPMMIYGAISNAWIPNYFNYMDSKNYKKIDEDIQKITLVLALGIFALIVFMDMIVSVLLNQKYHEALEAIVLLAIGTYFMILWYLWGINIGYAKKTIITSIIGIVSAVLNVVLNWYLVPLYELKGAIYATLVSYAFMAFCGYVVSQYILKLHTTSLFTLRWSFLVISLALCLALINNFYVYLFFKIFTFFGMAYMLYKYQNEVKEFLKNIGIAK